MTMSRLTTATVQIPFSQIFSLFAESIACQVVFFLTDSPWICWMKPISPQKYDAIL